jgi:hypothetical protein
MYSPFSWAYRATIDTCISIALFTAIPQQCSAKNNGSDAFLVDLHAFDPVGRYGALDKGMFPESLEPLGRLPREEFLLPTRLPKVGQIP